MRLTIVAVALSVASVLALPLGAEAAVDSVSDRRGDEPVEVDVVRASLANGADAMVARVTFRKLKARTPSVYVYFEDGDGQEWSDLFVASRWSGSGYEVYMTYTDALGFQEYTCDGVTSSWRTGRGGQVTFRIPRSCVGIGGTVSFRGGAATDFHATDRTRKIVVARS